MSKTSKLKLGKKVFEPINPEGFMDMFKAQKESAMTGKHTSGPWDTQGGYVYDSEGRIVCNPHDCLEELGSRISGREREANARLIAAAPELLNVCKAALSLLLDPDATEKDADMVTDELRVAISKAEGDPV